MFSIETLLARLDIVAVIRDRGFQLEPHEDSLRMPCPFRTHSLPSPLVSPKTGLWECLICRRKGNVIGFIQDLEGGEFWAVAQELHQQYFPAEFARSVEEDR